jgi:hypothetical protein
MTCDVFMPGDRGVNFLARVYTRAVWNGCETSTCDLKRTLSKLHVAPQGNNVTPLHKLERKLLGLWRTDRQTPIVHQLCHTAVRLGMQLNRVPTGDEDGWWTRFPDDVNWPNASDDIDDDCVFSQLPECDVTCLYSYLEVSNSVEQLLSLPCVMSLDETKVEMKISGVIDDVYVEVNATDEEKYPRSISESEAEIVHAVRDLFPVPIQDVIAPLAQQRVPDKRVGVCFNFLAGKCLRKKCKFDHPGDPALGLVKTKGERADKINKIKIKDD